MSGRTLFVHIGCHKTGTTSIQQALVVNKEALANKGIQFYYRDYFTGNNLAPELHSWIELNHDIGILPDGMRIRDVEKLARELSEIETDVIISSENFSFFFDQEEITGLQGALSQHFPNIKIICYIRRQDQHVISHHQEGSKLNRRAEYDLYGHSSRAIPPYEAKHDLYLDYHKKLGTWADAFGDENLVIRVFDRKKLLNGDVVADFFDVIGVDEFLPLEEKNTSLSAAQVKVGHLVNSTEIAHRRLIADLVLPKLVSSDKLMPARKDALEYYTRYIESNKALNHRFRIAEKESIFDADFDMYPEEATDVWSEEAANEAIVAILEAMDHVYGRLSADELRDAAITLDSVKLEISHKLMSIAQMLRPNGPLINQKLGEYRARLQERSNVSKS